MVQCACCGAGTLEIKCPFSCQNKSFTEACDNSNFFWENVDEIFSLKKSHSYYYQEQAEMKLTKRRTVTLLLGERPNYLSSVSYLTKHLFVMLYQQQQCFIKEEYCLSFWANGFLNHQHI